MENYEEKIIKMAEHIQETGHFIHYLNTSNSRYNQFGCNQCDLKMEIYHDGHFFSHFLKEEPWNLIINSMKDYDSRFISFNNAIGFLIYDKKVQSLARMKSFL